MKQFRFILLCATIGVMTAGLTGCTKSVYDEKQALEAQQGLLQFKYAEETKLELLRQSGATALQQLIGQFALKAITTKDSLDNVNAISGLRKRDISIRVVDIATGKPVGGATVSIPTVAGTILTATSDSATGYAYFPAEKNGNVPIPASVIVSKTGYASGSVYRNVYGDLSKFVNTSNAYYPQFAELLQLANLGTTEVSIWSQAKTPNTISGKVYIENDLTNTAAEVAAKALVSVYTVFSNQRFEWSALTDADGNYSISVPDMSTNIYFNYSALESNAKLYVNGTVPGLNTTPSLLNVPATYYLGQNSTFDGVSPNGLVENGGTNNYQIPASVARYHAMTATADSLGNKFYANSITFSNTGALTSASINPNSPNYYYENTTTPKAGVASRYVVAKALVDTAVFYDVLANSDKYWKTLPVLEINYTKQLLSGFTDKASVTVSTITQKTAGTVNNVEGAVYLGATLNNRIYTTSTVNSSVYNDYSDVSKSLYFDFIYAINLNGGKKVVKDLSFGAGKLSKIVR